MNDILEITAVGVRDGKVYEITREVDLFTFEILSCSERELTGKELDEAINKSLDHE